MAAKIPRIVIDADVGTDDYLAILILLDAEKRGQLKIEGIVCTTGNATLDNVCRNVVRLLEIVNRTDIPVYRGAAKQFIPFKHEMGSYHGPDGFAGLQHATIPDTSIIKKEPAALAIGELVINNPNEITLVCLAPLTNLALMLLLYDNFADSVKEVWLMGGNYNAVGNCTPSAEFNFYFDPEAAHIVLEMITKPIYMLTWETCLAAKIPMEWFERVFAAKNNPEIQLLVEADRKLYKKDQEFWLPCDAFLAGAFVSSSLISQKSIHNVDVELHGSLTRGQVVLDHTKTKPHNVTIIEKINDDLFQKLLLQL